VKLLEKEVDTKNEYDIRATKLVEKKKMKCKESIKIPVSDVVKFLWPDFKKKRYLAQFSMLLISRSDCV